MEEFAEEKAEEFLEKNKFPIVSREVITNKEDIHKIKLKFPWVMKVSSLKIMHKNKVGGIRLNVGSTVEAEKIFDELKKIKNFSGVMIQETFSGQEAILGIKKTKEFGHVLMFGGGGTKVEEKKDITFRMLPLKEKELEEMIKDTEFSKKLNRQQIKKIIKIGKKLSVLIKKNNRIEELDINPLIIKKKEIKIVDARIIFK